MVTMSRPSMLRLSEAGGFIPPLIPSELTCGGTILCPTGRVFASGVATKKREEKREAKPKSEIQSRRERRIDHLPRENCDERVARESSFANMLLSASTRRKCRTTTCELARERDRAIFHCGSQRLASEERRLLAEKVP